MYVFVTYTFIFAMSSVRLSIFWRSLARIGSISTMPSLFAAWSVTCSMTLLYCLSESSKICRLISTRCFCVNGISCVCVVANPLVVNMYDTPINTGTVTAVMMMEGMDDIKSYVVNDIYY